MVAKLAPSILVASPGLACPYFHRTVVLLVDHREDGSLGFVINRPSPVHFPQVLAQVGLEHVATTVPDTAVMLGGPVSPETGWVVFDPADGDVPDDGVLVVAGTVGVSANLQMLQNIANGEGPSRHLMVLGYAGWGPGQLDREIQEGSWLSVDVDPALLFEVPPDERWAAAFAALGVDPARVVNATVAEA